MPRVEPFLAPPALQTRSDRTLAERADSPLKRISLELSRQCNLQCIFCYSRASPAPRTGLQDHEIRAIIDEAVESGARLISIVGGGESLLRKSLLVDGESCIDYANQKGCWACVYTNGTLVDLEAARWLYRRDVSVVAKLNSLNEDVQDRLAGVAGSAVRMRRGIDALLHAGFAQSDSPRFALESVICRSNYDGVPELWRWMRQRKIVPEIEIPTQHGRALEHRSDIFFDPSEASEKYRVLFEELLRIDRAEFGFDWVPHPPFAAGSCRLHYSNCYVNDQGGVQPCAGVDLEYGIVRAGPRKSEGRPLAEIVTSASFQKLRRLQEHLSGACAGCDLSSSCYGCRAAAFHGTGDVFGEDPVCWRNRA